MPNTSQHIRFAIIGYGRIGRRHARIIDEHPECEWVAACDLHDPEDERVRDLPVPYYRDAKEMLGKGPDCDVVCICTPNGLHAQHALLSLEEGCHVLIEKPMTLRKSDAERLIHTALNESRQVFCVMQNRYSPPARWMKEIVDQNKLGEIYMVDIQCYWNRDERYYDGGWHGTKDMDGGTLYTQFSHFVDIMYWLFGDIKDIRAGFADFNHKDMTQFEDSGMVQFRFKNGGMGSLAFSTSVWDRNFQSAMTVIGSEGSVKIGGQYMERIEYVHGKNIEMPELQPTLPAHEYEGYQGSANNHPFVFENVVDVLKGRKPIATNALEGMKVVEIIERIYDAQL